VNAKYEFTAEPKMGVYVGLTPDGTASDGRARWKADVYLNEQRAFEGLYCFGATSEEATQELLLRLSLDGTLVVR
jgi:hypothetical protein